MRVTKIKNLVLGITLMCSLLECASAAAKNERAEASQPEDIVQLVCIDRVMNQDTFMATNWKLEEVKAYFSKALQTKTDNYTGQYNAFYGKYKNYAQNITQLGGYLMLSQTDPVTLCPQPPLHPKKQLIQRSQTACEYKVEYQEYGNDRKLHGSSVLVQLTFTDGKWLISEVQYGEPFRSFDQSIKPIQTFSEMLVAMTKELHDAAVWATQHRKDLVPNGTVQPVGRGPFDRP